MDYKSILLNYISEADATNGSIVYQPYNGLIEVCESEETKLDLLNIVEHSTISLLSNVEDSAYQDLIKWSRGFDLLLESSDNILFCIPKVAA